MDLIGQIYEATAVPELWPTVLDGIAKAIDAFGAVFVHRSGEAANFVINPRMEEFAAAYVEQGWVMRDDRVPPVIAEHFPGFRVDADYWTEEQQREIPIYRDFLLPRDMKASAACLIQGVRHDSLHVGIEGLPSYAEARSAVPFLDSLRPHLARALSISARLAQSYSQGVVDGLQASGVGAAVIGPSGRLKAANELFGNQFGGNIIDLSGHIRLPDDAANRQLRAALALGQDSRLGARSFPVRNEGAIAALHCLPLKGRSQDIFESDGFVVVIAWPDNHSVPSADLLRLMFDLTPAEARIARLISQGQSVAEAARACGVQANTARIHLKAIYAKTGFARQSDLAVGLSSLGTGSGMAG
jgi:DNA-binding CsgD family transcriptional regulator